MLCCHHLLAVVLCASISACTTSCYACILVRSEPQIWLQDCIIGGYKIRKGTHLKCALSLRYAASWRVHSSSSGM